MRKFIDSLKARKAASENEAGFSLIDVVVTVAIIVALSVGGFIAYNGIVDNAKQASLDGAADQVYTAAIVADNDTDAKTTPKSVADAYAASSNGIKVDVNGSGDTLSVTASKDGKTATAGYVDTSAQ